MSGSSGKSHVPASYDDNTSQPPWEQRSVARVPYLTSKTEPLTMAEKEALPAYWAADGRQNAEQHRPRTHSKGQRSTDRIMKQLHHEDRENDWRHSIPKTAPPFASGSPPELPSKDYHRAVQSDPKLDSQLPAWVKGPPSPPESFSSSAGSDKTVFSTGSQPYASDQGPPSAPVAPSQFPGTMSHHDTPHRRSRTQSAADRQTAPRSWSDPPITDREATAPKKENIERGKFGSRFKSAFKSAFKRDPIDESQFERIGDKHWTDES
ncbi:unnamed protein product [Zymoseptoria tritici ST99CH_1A5]|uniref:Uncharacterized protein n=1 Tax=Zymoseptoria tritici ST99CH_1A5 TaxID=1276529 RepID=A0A1Y6LKF6_ZYMTR|nr:unnamed protein product [Zymoseptoria tritici ST99CH_1A5]